MWNINRMNELYTRRERIKQRFAYIDTDIIKGLVESATDPEILKYTLCGYSERGGLCLNYANAMLIYGAAKLHNIAIYWDAEIMKPKESRYSVIYHDNNDTFEIINY